MKKKKLISLIIPVYNEEKSIPELYKRVNKLIHLLADKYCFELLFTDNHSEDNSFQILRKLAEKDPMVKVARFSRNFGYQRSILTGFLLSSGDAAVQLDCDLQDPPELIPQFIEKWEQGYKVVYGVREERQEGWVINKARKMFYRFINFLSEDDLPRDAGDFRLIDSCIIDELRKIEDACPYLRGTIATMGFEQVGIPYVRDARLLGKSGFSLSQLIRLALDGIISHSIIPLRVATFLGFVVTVVAILLSLAFVYAHFFGSGDWPRGFATTTVLILLGIGLNGLFLGIVGEYLGRIYLQVKKHPLVILEKLINFSE